MFKSRQYIIFFCVFLLFSALLGRLFYLQVMNHPRFIRMADNQHNTVFKVEPRRGTIFDRYLEPLGINLDMPSVYCDPRSVTDKSGTAETLSRVLDVDRDRVFRRLSRDKAFVWIKRKVDRDVAAGLKEMDLDGVHFIMESKRRYPNDNMACHLIGFAGMDNTGLEGLELRFDDKLRGKPGYRHIIRDARRRVVLLDEKSSIPPQNGYNLVLTIDSVIQYITEREIAAVAEKYNAERVTAVVMDPYTGEVLAMASYPGYDLNRYFETPRELMKNHAVSSVFEPGSVFKIVAAGAALNEGAVDLDDIIDCENGEYRVGGRILHDYHAYDDLTFEEVIARSSNIGTVKVAMELGEDKLYEYVQKFGFGSRTGIDIPGEVPGISRPPEIWSRSDITTIPIGQGIAVTPVQLACGISVIANGGYLVRPSVVDRITSWEGEVFKEFDPVIEHRVLDRDTCEMMKRALRRVITDGTGRRASSDSYRVCGKTGTAQMVSPEGGYYDNRYYATFVGFAPMKKPLISIVIAARDPHPVYFGGSVAGPAFRGIAEKTLEYLGSGRSNGGLSEKYVVE
jgi:cell division protein FtsI (penicillin-binding protein 3)